MNDWIDLPLLVFHGDDQGVFAISLEREGISIYIFDR